MVRTGKSKMIRAKLAAIVAGLLSILGAALYALGTRNANHENEIQDHNEYVETRKRIDGVDTGGNDAEWLRERAKRDRGL